MRKIGFLLAVYITGFLYGGFARAGAKEFSLWNFRVLPTAIIQESGKNSYSAFIGWNPNYAFTDKFRLGLNAAGTFLEDANGDSFLVMEYQATLGFLVSESFEIEPALGGQTWTKGGNTRPLAGLNLSYLFPDKLLGFLDRLVLGYQYYFEKSGKASQQIRLGVGLSF